MTEEEIRADERAKCVAELRAQAAEWEREENEMGDSEAITLQIAACVMAGESTDSVLGMQERAEARRKARKKDNAVRFMRRLRPV